MGIREKSFERCAPYLQPGEQVRHVIPAQTGGSPWLLLLSSWFFFMFKYRLLCVTDRAVLVLDCGKASFKPKGLLARLPRAIVFGPLSGLYGTTTATGETLYVHRRFQKDAAAADADLMRRGAPAGAPLPPPPHLPPPPAPRAAPAPAPAPTAVGTAPGGGPGAAGWYPDPQAPGQQRWFDGAQWTGHVHGG